jgi:hypothetical protein
MVCGRLGSEVSRVTSIGRRPSRALGLRGFSPPGKIIGEPRERMLERGTAFTDRLALSSAKLPFAGFKSVPRCEYGMISWCSASYLSSSDW